MLRFVGNETVSFALRCQNVLADKGNRLNSVFVALARFYHPWLVDQMLTWCKQVELDVTLPRQSVHDISQCREAPTSARDLAMPNGRNGSKAAGRDELDGYFSPPLRKLASRYNLALDASQSRVVGKLRASSMRRESFHNLQPD